MTWKEIQTKNQDKRDWDANPELIGRLTDREVRPWGEKSLTFYKFLLPDGTATSILGTTVINNRLEQVKIGSKVKIVYLGKKRAAKGNFMDFKIFVDEADEPKELEEPDGMSDDVINQVPF